MLKDCANMALPAISGVVSHEEIKAPMRLRSAMTKILKLHNSPDPNKPQDIEEMDKNGELDHLKAEDETPEQLYSSMPK